MASERAEVKLTMEHPLAKNIASRLRTFKEIEEKNHGNGAPTDEASPHDHHHSVDGSIPGIEQPPQHLRSSRTF